MQKAQNFGQKLIQNPITQSKKTGKSIYFKAHAKSMRINTYRRERERKKEDDTCRPAREERETGFFLSLSLLLDLPIIRPLAPFPDILKP